MEPTILYEDSSLLVVDKPAGLIVHPDEKHNYPALTDWLDKKYPKQGEEESYFLVHRIDRETSGVLVVAKTLAACEELKRQFHDREVQKVYRAFVYGIIKEERGVIDKPIGSSREGSGPRTSKNIHGLAREAFTAYRVIERTPDVSYVEIFPKTGRTHQLRVHFASIQHPIVADRLYAPGRRPLLGFKRLALHALSLSFVHPHTKKKLTLTASLPPDFVQAEQLLEASKSE